MLPPRPRRTGAAPLEIAMGHGVVNDRPPGIGPDRDVGVRAADLDAYLRARDGWRRVAPAAFDPLAGPADGGNDLLLTFDDGATSVRDFALPVLERHGVPCVIFVVTGYMDRTVLPMEDVVARLVTRGDEIIVPGAAAIPIRGEAATTSAYARLRMELKGMPPRRRHVRLEQLCAANGLVDFESIRDRYLDAEAVRALDDHPLVTIGAHTCSHPVLSGLGRAEAAREICGSKERLESLLGHPVEWFAYPYGASSFGVRRAVRRAGFRAAFTTRPHRLAPGERVDPMALPRVDLRRLAA